MKNWRYFSGSVSVVKMLVFCSLVIAAFVIPILAQDDEDDPDKEFAPPPVKIITKEERKLLDSEPSTKKRTQLSIELMESKIAGSEKATGAKDHTQALNQLGSFEAVMDNTLTYLLKNNAGDKTDRNLKSFEIYLRKQIPRLETLRREMPYRYGYYVEKLMKTVRATRAKAIEPLFDDTVVPDKETADTKPNKP